MHRRPRHADRLSETGRPLRAVPAGTVRPVHVPRALTVAVTLLAVVSMAAACSSSPKATPPYTKGLTVFFTPDQAKAPTLPPSFANCTYAKLSAADRTQTEKVVSASALASLPDAVGVRLTRAANTCDPNLTNQLIEVSVFTGAPASISAAQKSCATGKIISAIIGIDDTKLTGNNSSEVSTATQTAVKACGISTSG